MAVNLRKFLGKPLMKIAKTNSAIDQKNKINNGKSIRFHVCLDVAKDAISTNLWCARTNRPIDQLSMEMENCVSITANKVNTTTTTAALTTKAKDSDCQLVIP